MYSLNTDRVRKLVTLAMHPTTNDNGALNALTKVRQMLAAAGAVPNDVLEHAPQQAVPPVDRGIVQMIRKIEAIEARTKEQKETIKQQKLEIRALKTRNKTLAQQSRQAAKPMRLPLWTAWSRLLKCCAGSTRTCGSRPPSPTSTLHLMMA
jgi:hypothetical protein